MKRRVFFVLLVLASFSSVKAQDNLIPMPIDVQIGKSVLHLSNGVVIQGEHVGSLRTEFKELRELLKNWGVKDYSRERKALPVISLEILADSALPSKEAYKLTIDKSGIRIAATSSVGIFYGLQTLRQFDVSHHKIQFVDIVDYPAFPWRGFLLDVGRNYQPIAMLKEQIDVMAKYKLNVLHFHFTEDLAWRLASKKYPGLTDRKIMRRWEGQYYTEDEFRELINYCEERHILFFPEIDMPGHSAAFERYFGVNMQSDSGMVYIKELLKEFRDTYPELPYLHIGGDEVKIVNKNFMPEITKYVEDLGYSMTMGWEPGSNLAPQTYRQLWMGGPIVIEEKGDIVYVDSKHLYINHMDPLETVTTLFHRRIGEQDKGHKNLIGGTLCSWPDRTVSKAEDMFLQNAVYPSLITFAERSWRGGGTPLWTANIFGKETQAYKDFRNFETRLLHHKQVEFAEKPFPYVKQVDLVWDLIGPYDNGGDLTKSFVVEEQPFSNELPIYKQIEGGTVILRHWWSDVVQGAIDQPQANTTWYARTKIYSSKDQEYDFWIGFDNLSRSYASDSPEAKTWDNRHSGVRVNNKWIKAPDWKQAGLAGDMEKPYLDEGYSYREPNKIKLNRGWNEVLIKLPVADFKGKNWQTPVKWMFTFVPLESIN